MKISMEQIERAAVLTGIDPMKVLSDMEVVAENRAPVVAKAKTIEYRRQAKVAELAEKARIEMASKGVKPTEDMVKNKALTSKEYKDFLDEYENVMRESEEMEGIYWSLDRRFELFKRVTDLQKIEYFLAKNT